MEREPRIQFSVSYTTRKPRLNEIPGATITSSAGTFQNDRE